jgi:hypothetical protein
VTIRNPTREGAAGIQRRSAELLAETERFRSEVAKLLAGLAAA